MTVVKIEELIAYMGGLKLNEKQIGVTDSVILPGVQQELERYLNRPVEPVIVRESIRPNDNGFLYFKVTPIHEIRLVAYSDGTAVTLPDVTKPEVVPIEDYRIYDEWGDPDLFGYQLTGFVGSAYPTYSMLLTGTRPFYRVEYVAGYNGYLNDALKLDIMRVSAREVEMQFDDTMSLRGGSTEAASDSDAREKGWTEDELRKWDRLRRRVVV